MSQEANTLSSDEETKELEGSDNSQEENELVEENSELSNEEEEMEVQNTDQDVIDESDSTEEEEENNTPSYRECINTRGKQEYQCCYPDCYFVSKKKSEIENHMKKHENKDKKYVCTFGTCKCEFSSEYELIKHLSIHVSKRQIKCPVKGCPVIKPSREEIKDHMKTHVTSLYTCPMDDCEETFVLYSDLKTHMRHHLCKRNKPSSSNNQSSSTSNQYNIEEDTEDTEDIEDTEEEKYTCPFTGCNKVFQNKNALQKHLRIHTIKSKRRKNWEMESI